MAWLGCLTVSRSSFVLGGYGVKYGIQMTRVTRCTSAIVQGMDDDPAGGTTYQPVHPMPT